MFLLLAILKTVNCLLSDISTMQNEMKYSDQIMIEKLNRIIELLEQISHRANSQSPPIQEFHRSKNSPSMYLNEKQASDLSGFSTHWFQRARWAGDGPPYIKVNNGGVRYNREDLIQWLEGHKQQSTSSTKSQQSTTTGKH